MKQMMKTLSVMVLVASTAGCSMFGSTKEEEAKPKQQVAPAQLKGSAYDPAVQVMQRRISRLDGEVVRLRTEEERCNADLRFISDPAEKATTLNWRDGWKRKRLAAEKLRDIEEQKLLDYVSSISTGKAPAEQRGKKPD